MVRVELVGGQCDGERLEVPDGQSAVQKLQLDPMSARAFLEEDPPMYVTTTTLTYHYVGRRNWNGFAIFRLNG